MPVKHGMDPGNPKVFWNWRGKSKENNGSRSKHFFMHKKTLEMIASKMIASRHPVIEDKQHTLAVDSKKITGWKSICNEFNAKD